MLLHLTLPLVLCFCIEPPQDVYAGCALESGTGSFERMKVDRGGNWLHSWRWLPVLLDLLSRHARPLPPTLCSPGAHAQARGGGAGQHVQHRRRQDGGGAGGAGG